jgi:hypothetical protein
MTHWHSTLGAPLTGDEEDRIHEAWMNLYSMDAEMGPSADPLQMLNFCTDTIMAIYELRKAINTAWNAANARAWPTPPKAVKRPPPVLLKLYKADYDLLTELFGEESANDQNPTDNTR